MTAKVQGWKISDYSLVGGLAQDAHHYRSDDRYAVTYRLRKLSPLYTIDEVRWEYSVQYGRHS